MDCERKVLAPHTVDHPFPHAVRSLQVLLDTRLDRNIGEVLHNEGTRTALLTDLRCQRL